MEGDEEEIKIDLTEISEKRELLAQLAYPSGDTGYGLTILRELESLQVDSIYLVESPKTSIKFVGKGHRGIVVKVSYRSRPAAVKILRTDAPTTSIEREAEMLRIANSLSVGPEEHGWTEHALLMEYVEGEGIDVWLESLAEDEEQILKRVLRELLEQAARLDEAHLDHGELSNPRRHVLVRRGISPVIVDFSGASIIRRPKNVTSLFSYMAFGQRHEKILGMLKVSSLPFELVRSYKREPSRELFRLILEALNLE